MILAMCGPLNMYKALIRPIAEYSFPLWSPFYRSHIESVEGIQRNFKLYAMHHPSLNYKERCEIMNILLLSLNCFTSQCIRPIFQIMFLN